LFNQLITHFSGEPVGTAAGWKAFQSPNQKCQSTKEYVNMKVKVKSFLSDKAYGAALISVSLAFSQTPTYNARTWIQG